MQEKSINIKYGKNKRRKNLTRTEPELTLVKAGFLNGNEELTTDGKEALDYIVYQANKQALKDLADKIVAEQEKESK